MSMSVADYSGQAWVQGFNEVGQQVFGMTANELLDLREKDESQFAVVLNKATCKTYNFSCRAKQDTYNVRGFLSCCPYDGTESEV